MLPTDKHTPSDFSDNSLTFHFIDDLNEPINPQVVSLDLRGSLKIWLKIYQHNVLLTTLELRYGYNSSDKRVAVQFQKLVAIGFSGYFCIYHLHTRTMLLKVDTGGYFGNFVVHREMLLVTSHNAVYSVNRDGEITWKNFALAIDGVLINRIEGNKIYGAGQYDPPDGWQDFILDLSSGELIK